MYVIVIGPVVIPEALSTPVVMFVVVKLGIVAVVKMAEAEVIPVVTLRVLVVTFVVIRLGIVAIVSRALAEVIPVVRFNVDEVIFVVIKLGIVAIVSKAVVEVIPVVNVIVAAVMSVEMNVGILPVPITSNLNEGLVFPPIPMFPDVNIDIQLLVAKMSVNSIGAEVPPAV